jgi:nicotinamide-nucleotide amidase
MFIAELSEPARRVAARLRKRGDTVAVAEGSAGGLISAALLSVPGASAYYLGGTVVYTSAASRAWMSGAVETPHGMRGATEVFATYLARSVAVKLGATWGIGEAGAAGPANPYGDPAGHTWLAIAGTAEASRNILTGLDDRSDNMVAFALAALELFAEVLAGASAN